MKLNDSGFPDFMEAVKKFDLSSSKNKELREYFEFMYNKYNSLHRATFGMSPEQIKFLDDLEHLLRSMYIDEIGLDEHYFCPAKGKYKEIMNLFENEPDRYEAVQKLFDIYMKDRARDFTYGIETLLNK